MKKSICLLLCLCLSIGLFGCQTQELRSPGNFYYYRTDTVYSGTDGVICAEKRELNGLQDDLNAILELYCQGPISRGLENLLPKDCSPPACSLEDGTLTLRFGAEFAVLSGIELTITAGCLARTFLELTDAETLVLTADGALLNGQSALYLTLADLGLQDDSLDRLHGVYTVYYTDPHRRYLVGQTLSLNLTSLEELPQLLLERMLSAPSGSGLQSVLPVGTRIRSVRIRDGICTVDLSGQFEQRRFYSHTGQLLSLMGIVNTLTALDTIEQVEFTVDGDLLTHYGSLVLSAPLRADSRFLGPVRTALNELDATLYVVQDGGPGLIPMPTRLRQSGAVSTAELVMQALLQDPGTNGFATAIPAGTALLSLQTIDGICYVDLNGSYLSAPDGLRTSGRVIAASLCALDDVDGVCITVNGSTPEGFESALFGVLIPEDDWFL